jgi:hypothetical protein
VTSVDRDDQELCHRIPNEILLKVYNSTSDPELKREILRFNYSSFNIVRSAYNDDHSRMENLLKKNSSKGPLAKAIQHKGGMTATALLKMSESRDYSADFVISVGKVLAETSPCYQLNSSSAILTCKS